MDNEKQKQEVIEFLESTYTGAKMMGDDEQGIIIKANDKVKAADDPENMLEELA